MMVLMMVPCLVIYISQDGIEQEQRCLPLPLPLTPNPNTLTP